MKLNKKSPTLRIGIFLLLGILLIFLVFACKPTAPNAEAPTPSPDADLSYLEVGSTSGIFIGSSAIVLIVVVPLIAFLLKANKKERR